MTKFDHLKIINLPNVPINLKFDSRGIKKLVILPDYSPSKAGLDVGTVAVFDRNNYNFNSLLLGQDIGCGMTLVKFDCKIKNLEDLTNDVAGELIGKKECIGSLGGGNHFITFYEVEEAEIPNLNVGDYVCVIHTGSRGIGALSFDRIKNETDFLESQDISIDYARKNRKAILDFIEETAKIKTKTFFDRIHNFLELDEDNAIYRKGTVKIMPGELTVLTSSMSGEGLILKANEKVSELEYSLPHGTGRKISRSEARSKNLFLEGFPKNIYVPYFIYAENLNTEMPSCYKTISEIYPLIENYVTKAGKLKPKSSIMI